MITCLEIPVAFFLNIYKSSTNRTQLFCFVSLADIAETFEQGVSNTNRKLNPIFTWVSSPADLSSSYYYHCYLFSFISFQFL